MLVTPIILCGGGGTRLWPASRDDRPKPFLDLVDGVSTMTATLERIADPALFAPPIVIANERHRFLVAEAVRRAGRAATIVLEPQGRDSAPAIAAGLLCASRRDPASICVALAADHLIGNVEGFRETVRAALPAAVAGRIVVVGIPPTEPATGFGYVRPGTAEIAPGVRSLSAFVEKPDRPTASRYLAEGYLWNAGMFLLSAETGLAELHRHAPAIISAVSDALDGGSADADFTRLGPAFAAAPKISIDYAVMEKTDRAAIIAARFDWSDIGNWAAVWAHSSRDPAGNAVSGDVLLEATRDSLVRAGGMTVALAGVEDLVVVVEGGVVMVARRDRAELVKNLADRARRRDEG
jgi:mannose-1-phosphate guanylyltransferase/mannose-6-phosphate isomerase